MAGTGEMSRPGHTTALPCPKLHIPSPSVLGPRLPEDLNATEDDSLLPCC